MLDLGHLDRVSRDRRRGADQNRPLLGLARTPRDLADAVLAGAARIAGVPHELLQLNKRWVYRAMDAMGARTAMRAATDLGSIASHVPTIQENMVDLRNRIRAAATGD